MNSFERVKRKINIVYKKSIKSPFYLALITLIIYSIFPLASKETILYHKIIITAIISIFYTLYRQRLMSNNFIFQFILSFIILQVFHDLILPIIIMAKLNPVLSFIVFMMALAGIPFGIIEGLKSSILLVVCLYLVLFVINRIFYYFLKSEKIFLKNLAKPFVAFVKNPYMVLVSAVVILAIQFIPVDTATIGGTFVESGKQEYIYNDINAVLMNDGNVFILQSGYKYFIYNPITEKTIKTGELKKEFDDPKVISLNNGKLLILGDYYKNRKNLKVYGEIYDPKTDEIKLTDEFIYPTSEITMTEMQNGKVLITGGAHEHFKLARIYDISNNKFYMTSSLNEAKYDGSSILLNDGTVLVIGGNETNKAEIYNLKTGKFKMLSKNLKKKNPTNGRTPQLFKFKDGKIFIYCPDSDYLGIYNPKLQMFQELKLNDRLFFEDAQVKKEPIYDYQISLLKDDRILIYGGMIGREIFNTAQIYLPDTNKIMTVKNKMNIPRNSNNAFALTLKNGNVLFVGGETSENRFAKISELFIPEK